MSPERVLREPSLRTARPRARAARTAPGRSWRHQLAQLLQPGRADAGNRIEVVDGAESAVLLPVVDDFLRRHGPDPGKRVQLIERRRVQMNRAAGRAPNTALTCLRGRAGFDDLPARNDDLASVRDLSREVDETQVGSPSGPTGAADRVRDSSAVDEPVEPRPPNCADDVDDEARRRRRLDLACLGRGTIHGRGSAADEEPPGDKQRRDEQRRTDERTRARDLEVVHAVDRRHRRVPCLSRECAKGVTVSTEAAYMSCMKPKPVTRSLADAAERHLNDVYRYVLYLTHDPQAAEELTAETFERAVRLWHRFDPARGSERTWLCQIARTAALDHLRAEERRRRREARYSSLAEWTQELETQTLSPWLRQALASLSAADREVIALRVILDLDPADAGRVLGISPSACTTRLSRALGRLEEKVGTQHVA
jgi:RNA polymerase sigma factor (sigma-70 family)